MGFSHFRSVMSGVEQIVMGEMCDGIAYIEWRRMMSQRPELPLMRCLGRHRTFALKNFDFSQVSESATGSEDVAAKYVRSIGSTAILVSPPDQYGRQTARAQTVGPWDHRGVQVGPGEEGIVDFIGRLKTDGTHKVLVEPATSLFERAILISKRSGEILKEAVLPVPEFIRKMRKRVPELVHETYDLATSIKIEVKFEDIDDTDDKPH